MIAFNTNLINIEYLRKQKPRCYGIFIKLPTKLNNIPYSKV